MHSRGLDLVNVGHSGRCCRTARRVWYRPGECCRDRIVRIEIRIFASILRRNAHLEGAASRLTNSSTKWNIFALKSSLDRYYGEIFSNDRGQWRTKGAYLTPVRQAPKIKDIVVNGSEAILRLLTFEIDARPDAPPISYADEVCQNCLDIVRQKCLLSSPTL